MTEKNEAEGKPISGIWSLQFGIAVTRSCWVMFLLFGGEDSILPEGNLTECFLESKGHDDPRRWKPLGVFQRSPWRKQLGLATRGPNMTECFARCDLPLEEDRTGTTCSGGPS